MDRISVLLVDDSPIFLGMATRFLHSYVDIAVVGTTGEAEEALACARLLQPQVILLDWVMPGLSGLELIPHLRLAAPITAIIVVTLLNTPAHRQAALAAGANDFVSKATLVTDLWPVIRRLTQPTQL